MQRLIQGQAKMMRTTTTMTTTTPPTPDGLAIRPLQVRQCRAGRRTKAMHPHPNWVLPLGPGHRTAQPPWLETVLLYIWREIVEL